MALLIPLGLLLSRIERYRYLAPFFILTGMWSLPILIQVQFPDLNLAFQYLTFDISLTIVLILVTTLAWQRKQLKNYSWRIVLMLVVSTLIALIGTLTQPVLRNFVFYSLLVIPFFYQLWFDSAELNTAGLSQGQKVVQTIGLQALLMVVVTWAVATGLISPEKDDWGAVAERLFLPPFLGLFLASMIGDKIKNDM
jgi:hypothetical protein